MTDAEFDAARWQQRAVAAARLAEWLAESIWALRKLHGEPHSSQLLSELEESVAHWGKANAALTFPASDSAAVSDLLAAEYQEAFEALSARLMLKIKGIDPDGP